ncbi:MAG: hypothetical protein WC748_08145 [Legionellales bacterium]|jgi:hypothetical protein
MRALGSYEIVELLLEQRGIEVNAQLPYGIYRAEVKERKTNTSAPGAPLITQGPRYHVQQFEITEETPQGRNRNNECCTL